VFEAGIECAPPHDLREERFFVAFESPASLKNQGGDGQRSLDPARDGKGRACANNPEQP
jgi:hypothetical protein